MSDRSIRREDIDFDKFIKATSPVDELITMVLRVHLLSEYYLDRILLTKIPRADIFFEKARPTFASKLSLTKSFSFTARDILDSLKRLNDIRNKCSHDFNYSVSEADIDMVGRPFGKKYTKIKNEHGHKLNELAKMTFLLLIARLSSLCQLEETELTKEKAD